MIDADGQILLISSTPGMLASVAGAADSGAAPKLTVATYCFLAILASMAWGLHTPAPVCMLVFANLVYQQHISVEACDPVLRLETGRLDSYLAKMHQVFLAVSPSAAKIELMTLYPQISQVNY